MKKSKFIGVLAIIFGCSTALAFNPTSIKMQSKDGKFNIYFKLVPNGIKTERADWVESTNDEECEVTHTNMPCRILGDLDGSNPSEESFDDILTNSLDFSIAYPAKVTYVQPE